MLLPLPLLTFAAPSLLPLLALLVPLAIHLWNRRPGREIAVGSLRWLAAGANRRLRRLRLEQAGLLALRLLLLAGLVGALAGPRWQPRRPPGRGQVLVAPALAGSAALAAERPRLDSLRRQGYGLRWLAPGLPAIGAAARRADSLGLPPDSAWAADHLRPNLADNYAERLRLAADSLAGQPLLALTPATLRGYAGTRRPLPAGLTCRVLPLPATTTWLQSATGTPDSLRLVLGHGTEAQVTFSQVRVARPRPTGALPVPGLPPLRYQAASSGRTAGAQLSGPAGDSVLVQPAQLRAWVLAGPGRTAEARTLRAALRAAALGLPGSLDLTVATTQPDPAHAPDWLFWLADEPVPASWQPAARPGLHLWQEPSGTGRADTTYLARPGLTAPVTVWRRTALAPPGETRWLDGQGRPLLQRQPSGAGASYRLATRLEPAWSDLAASPDLPALLLDELRPAFDSAGQRRADAHDPRRLDPGQALPTGVAGRRPAPAYAPPYALRPWLVLVVAGLFGLERALARHQHRPPLSAPS